MEELAREAARRGIKPPTVATQLEREPDHGEHYRLDLRRRDRRRLHDSVRRLSATQVRRHPTEKLLELMRHLIESSSTLGEVVLDPFAGSGSALVAAVLDGRRTIGVEIEERYAQIAAERLVAAERIADMAEAA